MWHKCEINNTLSKTLKNHYYVILEQQSTTKQNDQLQKYAPDTTSHKVILPKTQLAKEAALAPPLHCFHVLQKDLELLRHIRTLENNSSEEPFTPYFIKN